MVTHESKKAQGITVSRAVLNISSRDFTPGLTYVAVSRVKSLGGLLFEEAFDFERFRSRESDTMRMRREDTERRAEQHVIIDNYPSILSWQIE
ncbi:hypothetical protein V8E54_005582 [Elaphomyces granulatus]|jgi:ATP-dependent exoDNAse (exonuclease V) alpha subunit